MSVFNIAHMARVLIWFKYKQEAAWLAVIVILCGLLGDFLNFPSHTRLWRALQDFGHIPIFGLIAIAFYYLLKPGNRSIFKIHSQHYAAALILAMLIGGLIEFSQLFTQRDASLLDALYNLIGATLFLSVHAVFDARRSGVVPGRVMYAACILSCAGLALALIPLFILIGSSLYRSLNFPVINEFDSFWERSYIRADNASLTFENDLPAWRPRTDKGLLNVQFHKGRYSGVWIYEAYPDWRDYKFLTLAVYSDNPETFSLNIRIHDLQHNYYYNDRFNRRYQIKPGQNDIIIPLQAVKTSPSKRQMNMQEMTSIGIWVKDTRLEGRSIWINRIVLQ